MAIKTIFLDRDGVINKEKNYLYKINDFEFIEGVFDACQQFQKLGYKIIIVTNQSGIFRGYYTESDFKRINDWMIEQFNFNHISILETFHCPHGPESECECRKPKPGMFLKAQKKYHIDMKKSWLIGDKEDDITAAIQSGINNTILVRSGHNADKSSSNAKYLINSINDSTKVITN